jgi:pyruvate formate lyase activating enzyme
LTKARVGGIVDLSTVDWYGKVTSMIFFSGCNFRCPYCQNASLIPMDSGKDFDTAELQKRIEGNSDVIDAVGFSGGEPCLQTEALKGLAKIAKAIGLKVLLETNGSNPDAINVLADEGLLDYVAIDVKAALRPDRYGKVAGLKHLDANVAQRVRAAFQVCFKKKLMIEARTTIVPTLIDQETEIREIAREVTGVDLYALQQFSPEGDLLDQSFKNLRPPSRQDLVRLARAASEYGLKEIRIRTREYGEERVWP